MLIGSLAVDLNIEEDKLTQIFHVDSSVRFYVQYFGFSDRESYTYEGTAQFTLVSYPPSSIICITQ